MKMHIELYASLMEYLPPGKERFRRDIEVAEGVTVQQLIKQFNISDEQAHIVLVDGHFVCGEDRSRHVLSPGNTVAIWPPVAGG